MGRIQHLLQNSRLVTLSGPAGVGKTRLAVQAVARVGNAFDDGVSFIDLGALRAPADLAAALCEDLGLTPGDLTPGSPRARLVSYLSTRRFLLILDTCEHLVTACADLVNHLLRAAPHLTILATSRIPLNLPGEHVVTTEPLACAPPSAGTSPSEAAKLFAERAAAVVTDWALTSANTDLVHRLCARLDGVPLALELAATHIRSLPPERILALTENSVLSLRANRGRGGRHRTIETAIDWSFTLCTPGEQLLWARLSVLAGDFDLETAEHVCADQQLPLPEVAGTLSSLVDQSVLLRTGQQDEARFRLLDSIREFGARELSRRGETETVRARSTVWLVERATRAQRDLPTGAQLTWMRWYERDQRQIREAHRHLCRLGAPDTVVAVSAVLIRLAIMRGLVGEALDWSRRADEATASATAPGAALAMHALLLNVRHEAAAAKPPLARAREFAAAGDEIAGGFIALAVGLAAFCVDDLDETRRQLERATSTLARQDVQDVLLPFAHAFAAGVAMLQDDSDTAVRLASDVVADAAITGELWARSYGELVWGVVLLRGGDPSQALTRLREALRVKRDLDDALGLALALEYYSANLVALGDQRTAARLLGCVEQVRGASGVAVLGGHHARAQAQLEQECREALGAAGFDAQRRIGREIGVERMIADLLHEAVRETSAVAEEYPAPLTKREFEIAQLVALGLTNRQISDKLGIGKRTADTHVENILTKLDANSRVQIAIWVQTMGNRRA